MHRVQSGRRIVTLRITDNEEQFNQCYNVSPEGRIAWMQDRGKPIKVYLPAHPPNSLPGSLICKDQISFDIADDSGLADYPGKNLWFIQTICRHALDMD